MSKRYVAYGPYFSGDTDDLDEAREWVSWGVGAVAIYERIEPAVEDADEAPEPSPFDAVLR